MKTTASAGHVDSINYRHQASLVILVRAGPGRSLEGISLSVHVGALFRNFGGQKIQVGRDLKIRRFLPH